MRHDPAGQRTDAGTLSTLPGQPSSRTGAVGESPLSWETLALLRGVPVAVAEQWPHAGMLVAVARLAAEDGHRAGLPVARTLIALKTAWFQVPELRRLPSSDQRALLERVVTGCIQAYYAAPDPSAAAPPRGALHLLPANDSRERLDALAAALLEMGDQWDPAELVLSTGRTHERTDGRASTDAGLEHRLQHALAGMPAEEVIALIGALRRLHAFLRASRRPRASGQRSGVIQLRPPRP
jgi:hypothetical protein